jgi:hypothetical protein
VTLQVKLEDDSFDATSGFLLGVRQVACMQASVLQLGLQLGPVIGQNPKRAFCVQRATRLCQNRVLMGVRERFQEVQQDLAQECANASAFQVSEGRS